LCASLDAEAGAMLHFEKKKTFSFLVQVPSTMIDSTSSEQQTDELAYVYSLNEDQVIVWGWAQDPYFVDTWEVAPAAWDDGFVDG
jgi:hypothetical protein